MGNQGGMEIIASPADMNLTIPVDDWDEQMDDQVLLDADVGEDLPLLTLETKPGCKTAPIVVEQYELSAQFEQNAERPHRRLARHLKRLPPPTR